jgi:MFS family permease
MTESAAEPRSNKITAAFGVPAFRRIWGASLCSNLGLLIQSVGSAWAMTQLSHSATLVALVQTSLMLPLMIFAMPAGAIADMYDRRIVALIASSIALAGASGLAISSATHILSPYLLLTFCFVIGSGMALMGPVWQASVSEQVPAAVLPSAIGLSSIAFNLARSFGPAVGGVIVAAAGPLAAFVINVVCYLPSLVVMLVWKRTPPPMRLPPERMRRAIVSGARYIVHSPPTRTVILRTLATSVAGGAVAALMPLVSRDQLHGDAQTFGVLLGAFGVGAVLGAVNLGRLRARLNNDAAVRLCTAGGAAGILVVSQAHTLPVALAALFVAGAFWTISMSIYNIELQLSAPRWVAGRALAAFQAAAAGGGGIGAAVWGVVARDHGVNNALLGSAIAMGACALLGIWLKMPQSDETSSSEEAELLGDVRVKLGITHRSGPIVIEMDYVVPAAQARAFYEIMQQVQSIRQRNGAYDWSIARDIAEVERWTERFHCPTWLDYLRQRARSTQADRLILDAARAFHLGSEPVQIRRMLERPFGSVRWRDDTPDTGGVEPLPIPAFPGGGT